jgi:16S rRNA (adenine1518-N6/adenine1519-N6)-dimethyltransferase
VPDTLERVVAAAFGQRRKMLRSSLRAAMDAPEAMLAEAGIEPTRRAEEIDVAGFTAIARALDRRRGGGE